MAYRNKITLQLGLITMHVAIDSATAKEESLKIVCLGDAASPHEPTPTKQNLSCPSCGSKDWATFKRAKVDGKDYSVVDADEVAAAKEQAIGGTKDTIAMTVHPADEVRAATVQDGSVYYLSPSTEASAPGYALIVDTLKAHPEVALLALWTPVSRTNLYEIKLFGDTLVMEQRARPADVKVQQVPLGTPEPMFKQQMAMLLPMMTTAFDPAAYADSYRSNLEALLASKGTVEGAATGKGSSSSSVPAGLMDQLNAMLSQSPTPAAEPKKKKAKAS